MCKIAILTHHNPAYLQTTITMLWKAMANTDDDGFGAAWVTSFGKIGWVKSSLPLLGKSLPDFCAGFYADSGSFESDGGALLVHGRTATCGVNLENTHPMLNDHSALVHNGIVQSKRFHNTECTCDSELLLHAWNAEGLPAVARDISGYYAFGAITTSRKGVTLDVVRDDRASLYAGMLAEGWAFATTPELLRVTGADYAAEVRTNTAIRFRNGKHLLTESFLPQRGPLSEETERRASRAFGTKPISAKDYLFETEAAAESAIL